MLGYIRCRREEMLVKHHALYQALYCGLCSSAKKNTTCLLLPFLSYDFVFLAALRLLATGEKLTFEKRKCFLHPFEKKKMQVCDNQALKFSSAAMLFLTYEKMQDDLLDGDLGFWKKAFLTLYVPFLKQKVMKLVKKEESFLEIYTFLSDLMEKGRLLEEKDAELDEMCAFFASCLSFLLSFGLEGDKKRILSAIGEKLGRLLYTIDAIDDLEKDEKSGAFNPILRRYGSFAEAEKNFAKLDLVLSFYIQEMKLALDLLEGDKDLFALCEHIICLGIPSSIQNILKPKTEMKNERPL